MTSIPALRSVAVVIALGLPCIAAAQKIDLEPGRWFGESVSAFPDGSSLRVVVFAGAKPERFAKGEAMPPLSRKQMQEASECLAPDMVPSAADAQAMLFDNIKAEDAKLASVVRSDGQLGVKGGRLTREGSLTVPALPGGSPSRLAFKSVCDVRFAGQEAGMVCTTTWLTPPYDGQQSRWTWRYLRLSSC